MGAINIKIHHKLAGLHQGDEWTHPQTVWTMPALVASRSKRHGAGAGVLKPQEVLAKQLAARSWAMLTGQEAISPELRCLL